jgi:hypothetical protein
MKRLVRINANGLRVGEDHQNAKLTDREVDTIRDMHEGGATITDLARMFEVGKGTIHDIVTYRRRAQVAVSVRVVRVPDE